MACRACQGTAENPRSIGPPTPPAHVLSPPPRRPTRRPFNDINGTPRRTAKVAPTGGNEQ